MRPFKAPIPLMTDAYQAGHFLMIPDGMQDFQCSQGIYRKPLTPKDHRIVSAGLRMFIETILHTPIIQEDIYESDVFYKDFHSHFEAPFVRPYPWPKEMFQRVVDEFGGFLPIVVSGLADGTAHYVGEPHVQVWTDVPGMGELVGWIESSMMPYLWTSSIVATRGRMRKERFQKIFKKCYPSSSHDEINEMIAYRFHDFGRRGAASSQITGIAHLMNWLGTDTMDAAYIATNQLNDGEKFGACSIMAAAHRTITPWDSEDEAYGSMVEQFGDGLVSVVADSYDYWEGLRKLCDLADKVKAKGGVLIARPDSGDPVECVVKGLEMLDKAFGHTKQEIGLRVLNNAAIIQGDGVDDNDIFDAILTQVISHGYCPSNVAFGMGENNHKALRSDLEAAYKTCSIGDGAGGMKPVMKGSNTAWKTSLPCPVFFGPALISDITLEELQRGDTGALEVQYDGQGERFTPRQVSFNEMRQLTDITWDELSPLMEDRISSKIRGIQQDYLGSKAKDIAETV